MPEFVDDFLSWYLAPWRRMDRKGFGIALLLASVPSLLALLTMAEGAGGFVGSIMDVAGAMKGLGQGGDPLAALGTMQGAMGSGGSSAVAEKGVAWMEVLNNLLLLALFPVCRMRLRDMGYVGRAELGWALAFHVSVVNALIAAFVGEDIVPLAWLWTLLNFGGYIWLSSVRGKGSLAVSERMDYSRADRAEERHDPVRKDDYE